MSETEQGTFWPWVIGACFLAFVALAAVATGLGLYMVRGSGPALPPRAPATEDPTPTPTVVDAGGSDVAETTRDATKEATRQVETTRRIEALKEQLRAALAKDDLAAARAALAAFRKGLRDAPADAESRAIADQLAARIGIKVPKPGTEGGDWQLPPVLGSNGVGSWNLQPGSLMGRCPSGKQIAIIRLGWPAWRDYEVRFEIELSQGDLGFYMRGMAPTAQFSGFLTRVGVKPGMGDWYAVHATARGPEVVVKIRPLGGGEEKVLRRRNEGAKSGFFGFVLHSAGEVNIRQLSARQLR